MTPTDPTHPTDADARELLEAILPKLDRGGSPDSQFPDRRGEYWARCPFHTDHHPTNFSVSVRGYNCFVCEAQGGLRHLARKLGVAGLHALQGGKHPMRVNPRSVSCSPKPDSHKVAVLQSFRPMNRAQEPRLRGGSSVAGYFIPRRVWSASALALFHGHVSLGRRAWGDIPSRPPCNPATLIF